MKKMRSKNKIAESIIDCIKQPYEPNVPKTKGNSKVYDKVTYKVASSLDIERHYE